MSNFLKLDLLLPFLRAGLFVRLKNFEMSKCRRKPLKKNKKESLIIKTITGNAISCSILCYAIQCAAHVL
jgi:hypothetical protein